MEVSNAKKFSPKKAVCKHEGCFETPSNKGYCRLHFLCVLKGRAEGDQKPRGHLKPVANEAEAAGSQKRRAALGDELSTLDEAFASKQVERLGEIDLDLDVSGYLSDGAWAKPLKKAG
jgi:hypothetical protein